MPPATIVIATRNRAPQLRACLAALARQTANGTFEIVVVDNGSSDATAAVIDSAGDRVRGVRVADPNRAKARNTGIAAASGELVIFCDDDTIAPRGFVAAHVAAHAATANAVVSGPIVNVSDAAHAPHPGARHYSRAFFCTCNVSAAKRNLEAAGGFDERYDLYGWEDTDLGIRLRARGARRVFAWAAYIYHVKPPDLMALQQRRALAIEKGTMAARFVAKSPSWPVRLATGAYAVNFARAAIVGAAPLRRLYERVAGSAKSGSAAALWASEALIDADYVDALKAALKRSHA